METKAWQISKATTSNLHLLKAQGRRKDVSRPAYHSSTVMYLILIMMICFLEGINQLPGVSAAVAVVKGKKKSLANSVTHQAHQYIRSLVCIDFWDIVRMYVRLTDTIDKTNDHLWPLGLMG